MTAFTITSTSRTVDDQARIMFEQARLRGLKYIRGLYSAKAQEVIAVYEKLDKQGSSDGEIKIAMALKITEVGAGSVFNHIVVEGSGRCVFDIGPSSVKPTKQCSAFVSAIEARQDVERVFKPPRDVAYHIEVRP